MFRFLIKERRIELKEKIYKVLEETELMKFLLENISGKSRNNIKSMLTRGDIAVNGTKRTKYDFKLNIGDAVSIGGIKKDNKSISPKVEILHEDKELIAISKPSGLLSISTDKVKTDTAYYYVNEYLKAKKEKAFIVHRLDRDTSGVMIFAKNQEMKLDLQNSWNEIVKHRGYTALVEGKVEKSHEIITTYLKETRTHFVYSSKKAGDGDQAITEYNTVKQNDEFSLLDISIHTGRKNQIRVHLSEIGHPICGDKKYGANSNPLGRLCLHAGSLKFINPHTKELMSFTVAHPKSFSKYAK